MPTTNNTPQLDQLYEDDCCRCEKTYPAICTVCYTVNEQRERIKAKENTVATPQLDPQEEKLFDEICNEKHNSNMWSNAEVKQFVAESNQRAVQRFKNNVVKYSLDQLERDMLSGGMSERDEGIIERLRYWILEKEVVDQNKGEHPTTEKGTMNKCQQTLSGNHQFEEETKLVGNEGYMKIESTKWLGISTGLRYTWQESDLKIVGTGEYYCKHCGIYDDTRNT